LLLALNNQMCSIFTSKVGKGFITIVKWLMITEQIEIYCSTCGRERKLGKAKLSAITECRDDTIYPSHRGLLAGCFDKYQLHLQR